MKTAYRLLSLELISSTLLLVFALMFAQKEVVSHEYIMLLELKSYVNENNRLSNGGECDWWRGWGRPCDPRFDLSAKCKNGESVYPVVYYPASDSYYSNKINLAKSDFEGRKFILFVNLSSSKPVSVKVKLYVEDVDFFVNDIMYDGEQTVLLESGAVKDKVHTVNFPYGKTEDKVELQAQYKLLCSDFTCGETCVVPTGRIKCEQGKVTCSGGVSRQLCEVYHGNFAFRMRLLHFEMNFIKDRSQSKHCTTYVRASINTGPEVFTSPDPLAEVSINKPNNLLIGKHEKVYNYLLETQISYSNVLIFLHLETKCGASIKTSSHIPVGKMALGLSRTSTLQKDNYTAIVTVETTCQPGFEGYACTTPSEKSYIERWPCVNSELSGPSCAYATLCEISMCLNGGTCVIERLPLNLEINRQREVDYTKKCLCKQDFAGRLCELALSSRCTNDTCLGRGDCEEAYYGLDYGVVLQCHCLDGFTGKRCQISDNDTDLQSGDITIREYALVIELLSIKRIHGHLFNDCLSSETHSCTLEVQACILSDCQQLAFIQKNESPNLTPKSTDKLHFYVKLIPDLANWHKLINVKFSVIDNVEVTNTYGNTHPNTTVEETLENGEKQILPYAKLVTGFTTNFNFEALLTLRCGPNKRGPNCDDSCESPLTTYDTQSSSTDDCWPRQEFVCDDGIGNDSALIGPSCLLRNWCKRKGCEKNNKCEMLQDRSGATCVTSETNLI